MLRLVAFAVVSAELARTGFERLFGAADDYALQGGSSLVHAGSDRS